MAVNLDKLQDNSRILEPDLICSKDGDVLGRSDRETVRAYGELFSAFLFPSLVEFGRFR